MNFTEHNHNGVVYLTSDTLTASGDVVHGFSTRLGGVSQGIYASLNLGFHRGDDPAAVEENYKRFRTAIGGETKSMVFANQVHGGVVRTVTTADVGAVFGEKVDGEADGLITAVPGVCLTVFSADCLPILLHDPVRRVVAAVHAGWRGTANGIAKRAVDKMVDVYGSDPAHILAALGPSISKCCYVTNEDVPNAMTERMGASALRHIEMLPTGKFLVDIKGLNVSRLEQAGLDRANINVSEACTFCNPEKYWSHRATSGVRGSQAAMIALL